MNREAKMILAGGAAAAGLAAGAVLSAAVTRELVSIAMDRNGRKLPGGSRRLSGSSLRANEMEQAVRAAERLRGRSSIRVEHVARDGERLVGHWLEAEKPRRAILAMHGWRSSWAKDFGLVSDFWYRNGCSVLYVEQRGQCESGGDHMGFGLTERYDCLDWLDTVERLTGGKLPVYLCGVSMGAATVLMAAGLKLPSCVKGIMADCGYTSVHDIWKHVLERNLHLPYRLHGPLADRMCRRKIHMGTRDCSTVDALKGCTVPVFFVHGTADSFVPVEMTYENYRACEAKKRLFVVPGAEHGMSYLTDRAGYEKNMREFWEECEKSGACC